MGAVLAHPFCWGNEIISLGASWYDTICLGYMGIFIIWFYPRLL